ncbi:MAG: hypothetical protein AAF772_02145 [Acidobacteriota bacterium]
MHRFALPFRPRHTGPLAAVLLVALIVLVASAGALAADDDDPIAEHRAPFPERQEDLAVLLERANAHLAAGRAADARADYLVAVRNLTPARRGETLRAIARTFYLDNASGAALRTLAHALVLDAGDDDARALLRTLAAQREQTAVADAWLADADTAPRPALLARAAAFSSGDAPALQTAHADVWPVLRGVVLLVPDARPVAAAVVPDAHRVGAYRARFAARHPESQRDAYLRRHGADPSAPDLPADAMTYDLAEESFELFVPDTYRPEKPAGLLVWISPTARGDVWQPEVRAALAARNVIWVGANHGGNPRALWDRVGLALDALHNVPQHYAIDDARVYVGGYSGGGRTASRVALLWGELVDGGLFWFGCDHFRKLNVPERRGIVWPARLPTPTRPQQNRLMRTGRYAYVTGERDFNRAETKAAYDDMRVLGFAGARYLEIPDADHYVGLPADWFGRALDVLSGAD